jgi:threonyl-tRNA synthetase
MEEQRPYAENLLAQLKEKNIRATLDDSRDKIGAKIRLAQIEKVPYMLIIGAKEVESNQVSVRSRKLNDEGALAWDAFFARLQGEVAQRSL